MDTIWGERRFLVPGIVFLAVLVLLYGLSGTFRGADGNAQELAFAAIAAVLAGGLAGYPLGLVLYIPVALVWRCIIGDYNRFVPYDKLCTQFLADTAENEQSGTALSCFRDRASKGVEDPEIGNRFWGFMYERFGPMAADRPARGRWETMHTAGGMISAIAFSIPLSTLAILPVRHDVPWWDQFSVALSVGVIAAVVIFLLLVHARIIAKEAATIEEQWYQFMIDVVRRRPEILEAAALRDEFDEWALRSSNTSPPGSGQP